MERIAPPSPPKQCDNYSGLYKQYLSAYRSYLRVATIPATPRKTVPVPKIVTCGHCGLELASKTLLFKHLSKDRKSCSTPPAPSKRPPKPLVEISRPKHPVPRHNLTTSNPPKQGKKIIEGKPELIERSYEELPGLRMHSQTKMSSTHPDHTARQYVAKRVATVRPDIGLPTDSTTHFIVNDEQLIYSSGAPIINQNIFACLGVDEDSYGDNEDLQFIQADSDLLASILGKAQAEDLLKKKHDQQIFNEQMLPEDTTLALFEEEGKQKGGTAFEVTEEERKCISDLTKEIQEEINQLSTVQSTSRQELNFDDLSE